MSSTKGRSRTPGPIGRKVCDWGGYKAEDNGARTRESLRLNNALRDRNLLIENVTPQSFAEVLLLPSNAEKGNKDPTTRILKAIFCPRDEWDKGIRLVSTDYKGLDKKINKALLTGNFKEMWECAGEIYQIHENIPDLNPMPVSKVGVESFKTVTGVVKNLKSTREVFEMLQTWSEVYIATQINAANVNTCTQSAQEKYNIGKIIYRGNWVFKTQFIPSNVTALGGVAWCEDRFIRSVFYVGDNAYIPIGNLREIEARLISNKL